MGSLGTGAWETWGYIEQTQNRENIIKIPEGHLTIMNGDISTSGGKRGDMLRGILKIRRKRNTSVSKTSSRDRSSLRQIVTSPKLAGSCPPCHVAYDRGNKRRLVDSCGHERCYSCIGRNEKCAICSQMEGLTDLSPKQVVTAPSLSSKIRQSLMITSSASNTLERSRVDKSKVTSASSSLEKRRSTAATSSPVTTLERSKRSRFDSLLNISAATASTPENSLPRRRKEVRRESRRGSEDTQSHASLVSSSVNRFYSGPHQLPSVHDLPRPLYFEVPQPVPAPLTTLERSKRSRFDSLPNISAATASTPWHSRQLLRLLLKPPRRLINR